MDVENIWVVTETIFRGVMKIGLMMGEKLSFVIYFLERTLVQALPPTLVCFFFLLLAKLPLNEALLNGKKKITDKDGEKIRVVWLQTESMFRYSFINSP